MNAIKRMLSTPAQMEAVIFGSLFYCLNFHKKFKGTCFTAGAFYI